MDANLLTPQEVVALAAIGVSPADVSVLNAACAGLQLVGRTQDQNGVWVDVYQATFGTPAGLVQAPSAILGPNQQPAAGGLQAVIPLPPTVRLLVKTSALPLSVRQQLAAQNVANDPEKLGDLS